MSLINQMLRDLEQRRSADADPSPLGGLSSSGSVVQSVNFSVNYRTLAAMVAVVFVVGVVVAYLLGSQQHTLEAKNLLTIPLDNKRLEAVGKPVPEVVSPQSLPAVLALEKSEQRSVKAVAPAPVSAAGVEPASSVGVAEPLVEKERVPVVIEEAVELRIQERIQEPAAELEQSISIRPFTDEQQSQLAFQRAIKLLGRDNQPAALLALEDALNIAPNHLQARETLVALLLNAGRVSEAASSLRDGLQLMPAAAPLAKLYARILVDQGDVVAALAVLERARPAVSADPEYHALLAALYRQEKRYAQAVRTYQQILMQRPAVAAYWMGLALSQDAMGERAQALDAFGRAQRVGGLSVQVLRYIQSRIVALSPVAPREASANDDTGADVDEFEE